ncbi:DUF3225 domain-containing protein [Nocardioides sp. zg-536]|uniref:DUF3225 domain-containing protein n=1 Tax=Nocardioides faecalis TaxID=2803858 RepID=A0A939BY51_9ACTN|nr:AtzH-like domain-containing protein [Nocardioides faecalis]MBM9459988.1 DUF3225 domain-containing protein [Nocardioides faecalis]QVI58791.1 DUF3225 domain-containing protein [Nocardioides faecalis]
MAGQHEAPDGLMAAFHAYERALMDDDLDAMARLFAPGADTLRGDAEGLLVGHEEITGFRRGRGGAPRRRLVGTEVRPLDADHAVVVAQTELERGGRGLQTQVWRREAESGRWQVLVAHVGTPAPALDTRIWRVVGDPLVPGAGTGALAGETVAVKDVYAVAGHPIGAGNPARLAAAETEVQHASVLGQLLAGGADVRGIARTDEFAYSIAGANPHHGTPPNPRAARRVPGGSSSGSASAVSLGHASIGLGTDTAGSIRVPSAYQGLHGIRTTHGLVDRTGLLPLAPSFDTVGWMTHDATLLRRVGDVLLPTGQYDGLGELVIVPELLALATPEVADAVAARFAGVARTEHWDGAELLASYRRAFGTCQGFEAWQHHGAWLTGRLDTLGPAARARFEHASTISAAEAEQALETLLEARTTIRDFVGDRVVVLPSAASVAPMPAEAEEARERTLTLTCLASVGGLPAVSLPLSTASGLPAGACLVAARGRDRALLHLTEALS